MYVYVCVYTCRSGKYTLNMSAGSDGDVLLNSPGRDKDVSQQENNETKHDSTTHNTTTTPSTSHDPTATPSSNGLETAATSSDSTSSPDQQRKVLNNSNENNCTDSNATTVATTSVSSNNSGCNSEAGSGEGRKVNSKERLPDGEMDSEKELQDNFK